MYRYSEESLFLRMINPIVELVEIEDRNRRIGEFLKELHLTEGRNTGFKKILDSIRANGSPLPEFETDDEHS